MSLIEDSPSLLSMHAVDTDRIQEDYWFNRGFRIGSKILESVINGVRPERAAILPAKYVKKQNITPINSSIDSWSGLLNSSKVLVPDYSHPVTLGFLDAFKAETISSVTQHTALYIGGLSVDLRAITAVEHYLPHEIDALKEVWLPAVAVDFVPHEI